MDRFHEIPDAAVILRTRGVFRQAKVFRRAEQVFAAHGAGFIRLLKHGGTTVPTVHWLDLEATDVDAAAINGPTWRG